MKYKTDKEEKKLIRVKKDDGSQTYIEIQYKGKPDRLFKWNDDCRRGMGN